MHVWLLLVSRWSLAVSSGLLNKDAGYGRLQSSFYSMLMRTEVASGELQSLGEVVVTGRHFPTNRAAIACV